MLVWWYDKVVGGRRVECKHEGGWDAYLRLLADEDGVGDAEKAPSERLDRAPAPL